MWRRRGHQVNRAAEHGIHAVSQDHYVSLQDIVARLHAGNLITFPYQRVDADARDKLCSGLFGFFHQPGIEAVAQHGIRRLSGNVRFFAVKIERDGAFLRHERDLLAGDLALYRRFFREPRHDAF
ncbi:hypothetical protein D3C75_962860 [compost metagenome]